RSPYPADASPGSAPWVGDREADRAALGRGPVDRAGVAVPGPLPPRGPGLGDERVGPEPGGAAGEVLHSHAGGPETAAGGGGELAPLRRSGRAGAPGHVTR